MVYYGGIELGGTKIVCAIGDGFGRIVDRIVVPTAEKKKTIKKILSYFSDKNIATLGIGSFGPIDLNKKSETYGYITTTPKLGWEKFDIVGAFSQLKIPVAFDTDVNAACFGEVKHGAGKGLDNIIYGTVGTGIGFGVYLNGQLVHGLMHPETGHMLLRKHEIDNNFVGPCPYHESCLETLASGSSIEKRWHKKATELYDNNYVWLLEAYYLGQALCNCIMCYSPEKIILGGGVMHKPGLIDLVRQKTIKNLNGYIMKKEIIDELDDYIVLPELGDDSGVIGSIELGKMEIRL